MGLRIQLNRLSCLFLRKGMRLTSSRELVDVRECGAFCTFEYIATNVDSKYSATTFGFRSTAATTPGVQLQSIPEITNTTATASALYLTALTYLNRVNTLHLCRYFRILSSHTISYKRKRRMIVDMGSE